MIQLPLLPPNLSVPAWVFPSPIRLPRVNLFGRVGIPNTRSDYALVVIDINVPVMRVSSFLQLIRLSKPHLPLLVLSAFSTMENVATAFRWGATDFLEKPFELTALHEHIRRYITLRAG